MSLTQSLLEKTIELSNVDVTYTNTSDFNFIDTLDTNCNAIVLEATVIYFEIKNIPILLKTGKRLAARIYKIYYNSLQEICKETGGYFSCYSPYSFLMIYPKHHYNVSYVVDVAIKTATLFCTTLREPIEKHSHISFSMGIDHGNILGTKTISNDKFPQMVWFSPDIEKARTIAKECQRPFFVGLSGTVYHHLDDSLKRTSKRILGIKKEVDIWNRVAYEFDNVKKHLYQTNFQKPFEED
ncbi:MAG: hypothetical protein J6W30_04090 [Bacteroidales bacterium]|nr:hypothetical protein [Bacteroidales bacterium]